MLNEFVSDIGSWPCVVFHTRFSVRVVCKQDRSCHCGFHTRDSVAPTCRLYGNVRYREPLARSTTEPDEQWTPKVVNKRATTTLSWQGGLVAGKGGWGCRAALHKSPQQLSGERTCQVL